MEYLPSIYHKNQLLASASLGVVIGVVDQVGISDICRCLSCDSLGTQVLTLLA